MWMMCLDLISQQMQQFLVYIAWILTDVQVIVTIRFKAGHQLPLLKNFDFTAFAVVVQVFTNLEMVNLFIYSDADWVIFHE